MSGFEYKPKQLSGKYLNELWGVGAKHALYHKDSSWYHVLEHFPGALFDKNGYVLFQTEEEYKNCPYLKIGKHLSVREGIFSIPSYVLVDKNSKEFSRVLSVREPNPTWSKKTSSAKNRNQKNHYINKAKDIGKPVQRVEHVTYRILRDTSLARYIKNLHNYKCQICGLTIELSNEERYAEAHHIRPLGKPHNGPDIAENIICVCPNHHAQLDYGAIELNLEKIQSNNEHRVSEEFIKYHNNVIYEL